MDDRLKEYDEKEIDFGKLFAILWDRRKIACGIIAVCTLVAMVYSLILPPVFSSNTLVQTSKNGRLDVSGASAALALLGGGGSSASVNNYIEIMQSRAVLDPIMDQLDIPPETRKSMTAEGFAKSNLEIKNVKGTNLINVIGKGRTPEEAQMISSNVVENFLKLMTEMNQSSQSYMVKFLNERIATAKQESDEASATLDAYSREHKVYLPDNQVSAMVDRLAVYDKRIGDFIVDQQTAAAKIEATKSELGKQNANLSEFNMPESGIAASLREEIVAQEVAIVKLEQKYTDNHPDLINAKEQLVALKSRLSREIADAIASGTVSMNPTQSTLIQDLTMAQVDMAVASASEAAVRAQMEESDTDMAQLSEDALEYMKMKRNADIKNDVYIALVKQSEQSKIEATMESMDLQVIDKANLPMTKSGPKRTRITLGGTVVGMVLFLIYGFVVYYRKEIA